MARSRKTYVFDPTKGKMVEKGTETAVVVNGSPLIIPPLKPFVSPITGEEITSREQLRRHNRDHGVTNIQDYSDEWFEKRQEENYRKSIGDTPADRAERIEIIKQALNRS